MRKLLKIFGIICLIIILLLATFIVYLMIKSSRWRKEFESSINSEYVVDQTSEIEERLNERIEEYILSGDKTDFIIFTPQEVSQIIFNSLTDITADGWIEITSVYVKPAERIWNICALMNLQGNRKLKAWVCTDVTKDDMQTAQLYITNLAIQGVDIGTVFPSILTKVNQGIAEALVVANENGFVGRVLENMEIEREQLIVKGSLY